MQVSILCTHPSPLRNKGLCAFNILLGYRTEF